MTTLNRPPLRTIATLCLLFWIALFTGPSLAADPPLPALTGRVVDRANILSSGVENAIIAKLDAHEKTSGNQIVVVTLSDLMGRPIEDWGLMLGRGWGIGQAEKNNGIVFLIAPNERELRIEVGYGLEGDLPDATASRIIRDEIVPHFKDGKMEAGIVAGVDAIIGVLEKTYQPRSLVASNGPNWSSMVDTFAPFLIPAFWVIAVIAISIRRRKRKDRAGYEWYWHTSSGGGSGSSRSGGFSSGGFSGRGGSFGGGGASGKW